MDCDNKRRVRMLLAGAALLVGGYLLYRTLCCKCSICCCKKAEEPAEKVEEAEPQKETESLPEPVKVQEVQAKKVV